MPGLPGLILVIALAMVPAVSAAPAAAGLAPAELRCEYQVDPVGIDVTQPRLSWTLGAVAVEARGLTQAAYQVLVAGTPEKLAADQGDLWDSGKVESDQQLHIAYAGKPLASRTRCCWKVRVWDRSGQPSGWSKPAMWSMGLFAPADWGAAKWIGAEATGASASPHNGYHCQLANSADVAKWIVVDLGKAQPIHAVRLVPARPFNYPDTPGFLYPVRFKIECASRDDFSGARPVVDCTGKDVANPGDEAQTYGFKEVPARYVRVAVTKLARRDGNNFGFALAEMQVMTAAGNVAQNAEVTAFDSVELEEGGWSRQRLVDGMEKAHPGGKNANPAGDRALMLRKEIVLSKEPVRATAYVCGLGYNELHINGRKVGDHVLDPGFTAYNERVLYLGYDVTPLLQAGKSTLGVILGNGWFNERTDDIWAFQAAPWVAPPKLLLRIDVEYADGSSATICSDESWKVSTDGLIVYNDIRGGETCDARKAMPGWDRPGYDDSAWTNARIVPAPKGRLQAQYHPPIRAVESMRPVKLTEPKPGVYVFDLGANTAGWARLTTRGERGRKITLSFDERLNGDGTLNMANRGLTYGRYQTDEFILAGGGDETFEPHFTYHGFRYVQVEGLTEKPTLDSLVGILVHTDPEPAGEFSCSNPDLNRIHEMILRTQLANLHGIPTDCPHREKIGWTGDGYITMEGAIYNFRMPGFYQKWWRDMLDVQDPNGHASCIAPAPGWGRSNPDGSPHFLSDPWWGGALVRLPWKHYRYYGDLRILEEAYEPMKKYLDYAATWSPGHISWANEGDWLEVEGGGPSVRTPTQLAGTAAYFQHAKIVAEIARLLGKADDAARYSRLAEDISAAFHKKYFDAEAGLYAKDSQTAPALALTFGMTPADKRELVLARLLENITQTRKNHISSGIIGTYYVFQTLMEEGRDDVAYAMLTQKDFPGWLHMLNNGGTTVWESWNGGGSLNHPALGSIDAWLYRGLGGIRLDPAATAFKRILVKPTVVGDLTWVKCSHQSLYGKIVSNWRREAGKLHLEVTIPPNTTATVFMPTAKADEVTESGQPTANAKSVKYLRTEKDAAVYEVGSGSYIFEAPFPPGGTPPQ